MRGCLFSEKEPVTLDNLIMAKDALGKTVLKSDFTEDVVEICTEPLCNKKKLFTCYVCDGPNNICKHEELGFSQACQSDEKYCIKELSGKIRT